MAEKTVFGPHTIMFELDPAIRIRNHEKPYTCRDGNDGEEVPLIPTKASQCAIDSAAQIKAGGAQLLYSDTLAGPENPGGGYSAMYIRFFCRVTALAQIEAERPVQISALAVLKRKILFRERTDTAMDSGGIVLYADVTPEEGQTVRPTGPAPGGGFDGEVITQIPSLILSCFDNDLYFGREGKRAYLKLNKIHIA